MDRIQYFWPVVRMSNLHEQLPKMTTKYTNEELEARRANLFEAGSHFVEAHRDDVCGIDGVLDQIDDVVHWLEHYPSYHSHNARIEPGILFEGKPGTGKTLVSRYIATESGALFIDVRDYPIDGDTITGNDVKDMFYRTRLTIAKTGRPIILFWDEFEGSARDRSFPDTTAAQAATVSQLTSELDGVHGKIPGLVLIGCTNYIDKIDSALRRPGRMGLHIEFTAPDREGKKRLLEHYLGKVNTEGAIDYDTISYFFNDSDTAAAIEEAVNEAWRVAIKRYLDSPKEARDFKEFVPRVRQDDLIEVFLNRLLGPAPTFSKLTDELRLKVAIHETGHALTALIYGVPLRLITVRPGKKSLGRTITAAIDPRTATYNEVMDNIRCCVAGTLAEQQCGIDRLMGNDGDTEQATTMAIKLVDSQGTSATGMFNPNALHNRHYNVRPSLSLSTLEELDTEVRKYIDGATADVKEMLRQVGTERIVNLATEVLNAETLTGKQFEEKWNAVYALQ